MENNDQSTEHVRNIFNEFCNTSEEGLNREELCQLCKSMGVDAVFLDQIISLAFPEIEPYEEFVDFARFCECLATTLQQQQQDYVEPEKVEVEESSYENQEPKDEIVNEIQPRYVKDGKAYGRRSVPNVSFVDEKLNCNDYDEMREKDIEWSENCNENNETIYYDAELECFELDGAGDASNTGNKNKQSHNKDFEINSGNEEDEILEALIPGGDDYHLNIFTCFDDNGDGSVDVNRLFEMWKTSGITDPGAVLNALDIRPDVRNRVNGLKLSDSLERFVQDCSSSPTPTNTVICAFQTSTRNQLLHFNTLAESFKRRNEEMKETLNRSQIQTSMLAEEADDQYLTIDEQNERYISNLEQEWKERMDANQHEFKRERDSMVKQAEKERKSLNCEIDRLKEEVSTFQHQVQMLKSDNQSLNRESHQIYEKLHQSKKETEVLRNDLECLLSTQITDGGDPINTSQEEKFAKIIKEYEAQCRSLKDSNDELLNEVQRLSKQRKERSSSPEKLKSEKIGEERGSDFLLSGEKSVSGRHGAAARITELQTAVDLLKKEKKEDKMTFENEKAKLIENYETKIREIRGAAPQSDNKKVEEERRLLEDVTRQRDQLACQVEKLGQEVQSSASQSQDAMANLCREFAQEKSELMKESQQRIEKLESEVEELSTSLDKQSRHTNEVEAQLQEEKQLRAQVEKKSLQTVNDLEKSFAVERHDISQQFEKEMDSKLQDEIMTLKLEGEREIEKLQRSLDVKTRALEEEKNRRVQANDAAMLQETRRLEESARLERTEREEEFLKETSQLRQQMEDDKEKLKEQLKQEMERQTARMEDESQKILEKKISQLREEHLADQRRLQRENSQLRDKFAQVQHENERLDEEVAISSEKTRLIDVLSEKIEKEMEDNSRLQSKLNESISTVDEKNRLYSTARDDLEHSIAVNSSLEKEKNKAEDKIRALEREKSELEDSFRTGRMTMRSARKETRAKDKMIKKLQEELAILRKPVAESEDDEELKGGDMFRTRYFQAVTHLNEQMSKTKLVYAKLAKTEKLVKELYCENSHMMKALQLTERRQQQAEQRCKDEIEKKEVLAHLLHKVSPQIT